MRHGGKNGHLLHYLHSAAAAAAALMCEHPPWQQLFSFFVQRYADVTLRLTRSVWTRGDQVLTSRSRSRYWTSPGRAGAGGVLFRLFFSSRSATVSGC